MIKINDIALFFWYIVPQSTVRLVPTLIVNAKVAHQDMGCRIILRSLIHEVTIIRVTVFDINSGAIRITFVLINTIVLSLATASLPYSLVSLDKTKLIVRIYMFTILAGKVVLVIHGTR